MATTELSLRDKVVEASRTTGSITIKHPYQSLKFFHRVPKITKAGATIRFKNATYKIIGFRDLQVKNSSYILTYFEVE